MAARKPKKAEAPQVPTSNSGILREIADALEEWATFNAKGVDPDVQCSDKAKEAGRRALRLMHGALPLLDECRAKYGIVFPLGLRLDWLETAASWPDPADLGEDENWRKWGEAFTRRYPCGRSFIDEVNRWADELEKRERSHGLPEVPEDAKKLEVAAAAVGVSRSWLQQRITRKELRSYRKGDAGPHLVSMAEVVRLASPRLPE